MRFSFIQRCSSSTILRPSFSSFKQCFPPSTRLGLTVARRVSPDNCFQYRHQHVYRRQYSSQAPTPKPPPSTDPERKPTLRENIYTLPNFLTLSRIAACPILGWSILADDFVLATGLLAYAGITDLVRRVIPSLQLIKLKPEIETCAGGRLPCSTI